MSDQQPNATSTAVAPAKALLWPWIVVGIALLLIVFVRVRLREMPLERDEGEYAYAGQLILQGVPPYKDVFNMKLPGTYLAYAVCMAIFGQSPTGIHLGLTVVTCASVVLVFLIGRRILDTYAAATAAVCFALMSLSPYLLGLAGHATHFLTFFALLGVYLLLRSAADPRIVFVLGAGGCLGLAFLMKQHGIFFIIFGVIYFVWIWLRQMQLTHQLVVKNRVGGRNRNIQIPKPGSAAAVRSPGVAPRASLAGQQPKAVAPRLSHFAAGKMKQSSETHPTEGSQHTAELPVPADKIPEQDPVPAVPSQPPDTSGDFAPQPLPAGDVVNPTPASIPDYSAEEGIEASRKRGKKLRLGLGVLFIALALPYLLTCLVLAGAGVFPEFWFWTVSYASQYATALPLEQGLRLLRNMFQVISSPDFPLWLLPLTGMMFIWWDNRVLINTRFFLLTLLACSIGSVSVGFYFREHYFIPLLPVLAWFSGLSISRSIYLLRHDRSLELFLAIPVILLFVAGLGASLIGNGGIWFAMAPAQATRYIYGSTLFADTARAAAFIKENSSAESRIAVLGSEPQIYFHSHRRSATGYIYMYPLMEAHPYADQMQSNFISEIERTRPEWFVFVNDRYSWVPSENSAKRIDQWWDPYWQANLDLVMSFNIEKGIEQLSSVPVLEEKLEESQRSGSSQIMIFRAKKR